MHRRGRRVHSALGGLFSFRAGRFENFEVLEQAVAEQMRQEKYGVDNGAGWTLDVERFYDPSTLVETRRPVLMVPGYCMNCHILNYHPRGTPLIEYLVGDGFEVWAANMRGQGDSTRRRGPRRYGFADLALTDLAANIDFASKNTVTDTTEGAVDLVGCSLGATVSYVYLAHHPEDHRVGSVVNIGGPLRWNRAHRVLDLASRVPAIYSVIPIKGTRRLARMAIPLVQQCPQLLSLYMNPDIIDLSAADELVKTIDDPDPKLTSQIARWIKERDLIVDGLNISHSLYSVEVPIQCVVAMQDGVVTPEAALSILDHIGSHEIEIVEVGTRQEPHAHADLFISYGAEDKVFRPVSKWLAEMNDDGQRS